ncbi:ABC transporter, substrate-binding protein (cluster 5, nickel/peptides/opines) [hydrothermal vent metagenome]|uniref:ABC transporter, substrate-binding protein (Cluster 5, nickel/peptides/opines) n=1 Tax=hydrothermal vent metagenome TaxID=652676 RepID=A0A3B1BBY8_9ZZZZ
MNSLDDRILQVPHLSMFMLNSYKIGLALLLLLLAACSDSPWNDPYMASEASQNILYGSFSERPKHFDPARSYSSNEYAFIGQIYEPPLQYHFLKRPYKLIPLTATQVPQPRFLDAAGGVLPDDADPKTIAFSEYEVNIKSGIRYQPHPAFAMGSGDGYLYHGLPQGFLASVNILADFPETATREAIAEDYVYQIKRLAYSRLHSPLRGMLGGYIVGFADYTKVLDKAFEQQQQDTGLKRPFLDLRQYPLEGVEALDRYRYRIIIKGKYPQLVYWLAMPFFAPMPWEADAFYSQPGMLKRNISLNWYPVGTGPFMLTENNPNLRMVLARNPNFHGEQYPTEGGPSDRSSGLLDDAGKPLPFITKAVYSLERENIPYWNKFLQGFYDASGIASDSFDQAIQFGNQGEAGLTDEMREQGIKLTTSVQTSSFYMGFNMRDSIIGGYSDRARLLRQAISIAVDYEEYISIFANGRGVPAQGPIPPGIFGYLEGKEGINPYVYDVINDKPKRKSIDEAKRLLAQAGYPGGHNKETGKLLALNYEAVASGPDDKARLNWMRKQFNKLGIQLIIRATDYNRFQEKMLKGTGQIFNWGWNADYPDPENFLFLLHGPNSKAEGGGENAANYSNPKFDAFFNTMKNMDNSPERQIIINKMVEIARQDAPWVFGFHPKAFSLHHAWYKNVKPNLMANNTLKYKRLDPQLRKLKRTEWNPPVLWPVALLVIILIASAIPAVFTHRQRERSAAL